VVRTWHCPDEAATEAAGREIAHLLPPDAVVHLSGDLGSGKTFLARAIAAELGADPRDVASPSFAIVHEYPRAGASPIVHIDGYRLSENPREWFEIGIPEVLAGEGVKLVEWPKREFARFEEQAVDIRIETEADQSRTIRMVMQPGG
jgi:tRNA threonylcarbamoyladenosine biosynthesis protein TsaE